MRLSPSLLLYWIACPVLFCPALPAQDQPDFMLQGSHLKAPPADPAIARAIAAIDQARIQKIIEDLVSFQTRNSLSSMDQNLPPNTGVEAAAGWIFTRFQQISAACNGCLDVRRDTFVADPSSAQGTAWAHRIPKPTRITNIYAILRGHDPDQAGVMYLVTGHYDSRNSDVMDARGSAPGANDDASGVAVSLECARALSTLKLPATLVFAAVAGEEQGLVGSAHLARFAKNQGWKLQAVLNNDIVGGNTTPGDALQLKDRVRVFSEGVPVAATADEARHIRAVGDENDSPSRELARALEEASQTYFPAGSATAPGGTGFDAFVISRPDRYLRGGDHSSFNREGFAAVRLTEWREDYNHQHQNVVRPPAGSSDPALGDLIEFIDFAYVANVARLNAATLATLASSPGEPEKVQIDAEKLENGTTLAWQPAPGKVDHYELLWRDTMMPDWQFVRSVPPAAGYAPVTITVPISKDNVIFGVRAVDAAGHRGLAVVP